MRKNKLILLQIVTAFVLICTSVYAAVNATIDVSASKTTVERGEKVTVTLSLKDVDPNMKVESVEGYINYDEEVIEAIDVDSIQKSVNNTVTIGNETLNVEDLTNANINDLPSTTAYVAFNGSPSPGNKSRIVIDFNDGIVEDTELLNIDFKVKSDATIGTIEDAISYSMFVITAGSEESVKITKNVNLTVTAVSSENENNTNTEGNENTNTDQNKNTNTDDNTNTNTNKNTNTDDKNTNTNTNKNTNTDDKNTNTNTNKNTNTDDKNTNTNTNKNTNKNDKNTNTNTNKNTNTNDKNTNKNSNTNSNTNTNKNANTNKNGNTNTADNTTSGKELPATGAKMLIIPAIILLVVAYVSYEKYMKYKGI